MKLSNCVLSSSLVLAIAGLSSGAANAAQITSWNLDNVVGSGPDSEGTYYSTIYDKAPVDGTATSSGYIKYDLEEGAEPGLKVVTDAPAGASGEQVDNCIMAAGSATCNGPFQSGKRFKLDQTGYGPIDLVFNLSSEPFSEDNDGLYRIFQKYGNATGDTLTGFSIGLGFGIGDAFTPSSSGDGLSFVDFGDDPKNSEFSSLFAQGLFGTDEKRDRLRGYFSAERSGFGLSLLDEDLFQTTGLFGDEYGYEALFGDWMSYSMAPDGYFYDDDGDPLTDAVLMAHFDADSGKWIMNRGIDELGEVVSLAFGNEGEQYDSIADVEAALQAQAGESGLSLGACPEEPVPGEPCLAGIDLIEDLGKFNVTSFIDAFNFELGNQTTFTMRISALTGIPISVSEPGVWVLLAIGLGGLLRRRYTGLRQTFSP
ncbi:choice-of-anchor F family protein [Marinobacter nauticus]